MTIDREGDRAFLADVLAVCRKHERSLSHEDCHGAFMVVKYNDSDARWLWEAGADFGERPTSLPETAAAKTTEATGPE